MAGLVPAIHALAAGRCPILFPQHGVTASGGGTAWMAGTSPAMTAESDCRSDLPSDEALFGQVAQQGGGAERLGLVVTVSRFVGHRRCPARKGASIITRHGRACPGHPRLGGGTLSDLFPHDGVSVSGGGTAWVAGTSPAMTAGGSGPTLKTKSTSAPSAASRPARTPGARRRPSRRRSRRRSRSSASRRC